jgi:hypothetical protein
VAEAAVDVAMEDSARGTTTHRRPAIRIRTAEAGKAPGAMALGLASRVTARDTIPGIAQHANRGGGGGRGRGR